jgi:hypothetical protein
MFAIFQFTIFHNFKISKTVILNKELQNLIPHSGDKKYETTWKRTREENTWIQEEASEGLVQ